MDGRVFLVDDDASLLMILRDLLEEAGFEVETADNIPQARTVLKGRDFDVALVDVHFPGASGLDLLAWMAAEVPAVIPLVLSGSSSLEDAVEAVRKHAYDFVLKPIPDYGVFFQRIQKAVDHKRLVQSKARLLEELKTKSAELENRLEQLSLAHTTLRSHALAIQEDLRRARRIQQALLPQHSPFSDRVSLSVLYEPAGKVGGDLYDVFELDESRFGLYLSDVSGHGVSAALLTVFLRDSVHAIEREADAGFLCQPGAVLGELNRRLFDAFADCAMFITMTYLVCDVSTYTVTLANAGHPPLLVRRSAGRIDACRCAAPALGIDRGSTFPEEEVELGPGDVMLLYTDGVREVHDEGGRFFGEDKLREALRSCATHPDSMAQDLGAQLAAFRQGHPLDDDLSLLVLGAMPQETPYRPPVVSEFSLDAEGVDVAGGRLQQASFQGRLFITLAGTGSWKEAEIFHRRCAAVSEGDERSVIVDLTSCPHLDSTFLGILHEIVTDFEQRGICRFELQNVRRSILDAASELGLARVLAHVRHQPLPLPESMQCADGQAPTRSEMGRLLLRAHETLVEADPGNADRFSQLLELLRKEPEH